MTKAPEAAQAALDVMLTDAADGGRRASCARVAAGGSPQGWRADRDRAARRARRTSAPSWPASRAGGRSVRPAKRDRRFADPAWESSWLFRRLLQTHLAVGETVDGLISDADARLAR